MSSSPQSPHHSVPFARLASFLSRAWRGIHVQRLRNLRWSLETSAGFSLIEVVVAITIVVVGLLATVIVANVTVTASDVNERRLVATNLAREGLELVRNIRDNNWAYRQQQVQAGVLLPLQQKWDCYATSAVEASANPPGCNLKHLSDADNGGPNFVIYPNTGNGTPYLVSQTTNENTTTSVYLICLQPAGGPPSPLPAPNPTAPPAGLYQPTSDVTLTSCSNKKAYYRRIKITRAKQGTAGTLSNGAPDTAGGTYSIKVESHVFWQGKGAREIVLEEYLTDWRKYPTPNPAAVPGP